MRTLNLMVDTFVGSKIVIIGDGNTAVDSARAAIRRNKGTVKILSWTIPEELTAAKEEVEVALQEGLKIGQDLSDDRIQELNRTSRQQDCYNAALVFLGYRPRSEHELKQRLYRRGFDSASIKAALALLKEKELVDDAEFARFWRDNRQSFSPRSRWLICRELRQKRVPDDVIEQAVGEIDDSANAYSVAQAKARRLNDCDYQTFRRRLGARLVAVELSSSAPPEYTIAVLLTLSE